MDNALDLTQSEELFLDHLAYETIEHRQCFAYRWCRQHNVEPYALTPLGQRIRDHLRSFRQDVAFLYGSMERTRRSPRFASSDPIQSQSSMSMDL
jgi:hypothetical protein